MSANFLALNPNDTYVLACAYGPDSMCLLDLVLKQGIHPVVCFINYHSYESIEGEENALREYCSARKITLEVLDTNSLSQEGKETNFASWARKIRYDFFKQIYEKYDADALLIAHSQDDLLETYLTTKRLGYKFDRYGYSPISSNDGMIVIRPLLAFSKEDILEHNRRDNVPYSEHMSLYEHQHTRSLVRQEIEKMNEIERAQILEKMNAEYSEKNSFTNAIANQISVSEELGIRELIALAPDDFAATLARFFANKSPIKIPLTEKRLKEIRAMLLDYNPVMTYLLKGNVYLVKEYDIVSLETDPEKISYSYHLPTPSRLDTKEFELDFSMGAIDRGIKEEDYPLTIRTMLPGDSYSYRGYQVPVRRVFLDEEMPRSYRDVWPVFVNKDSKIVYVPRYHKNFKEYHVSKLKLHLPSDKK